MIKKENSNPGLSEWDKPFDLNFDGKVDGLDYWLIEKMVKDCQPKEEEKPRKSTYISYTESFDFLDEDDSLDDEEDLDELECPYEDYEEDEYLTPAEKMWRRGVELGIFSEEEEDTEDDEDSYERWLEEQGLLR